MSKKIAFFGVGFGFLLTLITIIFFANNIYVPDSSTYYEPARALSQKFAFLKNPTSDEYMFFRTPGYPLFLAFLYSIVDSDSFVIFVQYILFLATSWIVYKIAFEIFNNKKIAQIAFVISLFDFARLYFVQVIATETFFTFVLTVAI
ncbi:MAG: 2 protein, partial [Campylobacterota bacterium]|nr:2 protein [Campylobacterota bacterium]